MDRGSATAATKVERQLRKKQEHYQYGQQCTFQQGINRGVVAFARAFYRAEYVSDADFGMLLLQFRHCRLHAFRHFGIARTFGAEYVEPDHFAAVKPCAAADFSVAV